MAVIGVAVAAMLEQKKITNIRIALGAVAPTPIRTRVAEDILKGNTVSDELIQRAAQMAAEEVKPISDIRSSAEYRKEMVRILTQRAIRQVADF